MAKKIRNKLITGTLDEQSELVLDNNIVANAYENLVTELCITIEDDVLEDFRFYFEFILPDRTRFISEPLSVAYEDVESVNNLSRQPETLSKLKLHYKLPFWVCKTPGIVQMDIKATNDSVTSYKSQIVNIKIQETVIPIEDERYFEGDLLDWITTHKLDYLTFDEETKEVVGYATNPATGERTELSRFDIGMIKVQEDIEYLFGHKVDYIEFEHGWIVYYSTNPETGERTEVGRFDLGIDYDGWDVHLSNATWNSPLVKIAKWNDMEGSSLTVEWEKK